MPEKRAPELAVDASTLSSSSDSESDAETTIGVDFEFFSPRELDFHGIKTLFAQLFSNETEQIQINALVEIILNQKTVGSVVKTEPDSDPFAITTALDLSLPATLPLVNYLLKKAENHANFELFEKWIKSGKCCFIFHERVRTKN